MVPMDADTAAAQWLRARNPRWSDARIARLITRSHVIDRHPEWTDAEIDREVTRRLNEQAA